MCEVATTYLQNTPRAMETASDKNGRAREVGPRWKPGDMGSTLGYTAGHSWAEERLEDARQEELGEYRGRSRVRK